MRTAVAPNQETLPVLSPAMNGAGYAHRNASRTERAAAHSLIPTRGRSTLRLLHAYVSAGARGLTDHQAAKLAGLPLSSVCSCRKTLLRGSFVEDAGTERLGPYGKPNQVWRASQLAHDWVAMAS